MVGTRETGNETYVKGLVEGFDALDDEFELIVYCVGGPWRPESERVKFRRLAAGSALTRLPLELPLRTFTDRLDVIHTTYSAPMWARCPMVVAIHDISFAIHPEWFSKRDLRVLEAMVPMSIRRAVRVITISEFSRNQIIDHYRVPPEKVACTLLAAGPAAEPIDREAARREISALGLDPGRRYVLAVGNLQPRKNLTRLFAAFREVAAAELDVDLVVAGPEHYRAADVLREATPRIRFTGYVSDRQLAACYSCASVFAFPSLYEGFGIPPLEAMAHGVPVVCSEAGPLREVCGDGALYFDPLDVGSIAGALRRALQDDGLRAELVRAGRQREREFTWRRTAGATLAVYQEATHRG